MTTGKTHDITIMDTIPVTADSIYTMDRAYLDFERLYQINLTSAFFIIRAKSNMRFRRLYSNPVDKTTGIQADQPIILTGIESKMAYPEPLRRVRYCNTEKKKQLIFLTNHFGIPAKTVANIYRSQWQVELFFKLVKQPLPIKSFYGTSPNAVKTQIWIALSIYLLVAIVKKRLNLSGSLHTILQILEVNLFDKKPIFKVVSDALKHESHDYECNQLNLFD